LAGDPAGAASRDGPLALCGRFFQTSAPHGDSFQEACEILGVDPSFRRAKIIDRELIASAEGAGAGERR